MNGGQGRPKLPNPAVIKASIASGSQSQISTFFAPVIKDTAVRAACQTMEEFFEGKQQFAHLLKTVKLAISHKKVRKFTLCYTEPQGTNTAL